MHCVQCVVWFWLLCGHSAWQLEMRVFTGRSPNACTRNSFYSCYWVVNFHRGIRSYRCPNMQKTSPHCDHLRTRTLVTRLHICPYPPLFISHNKFISRVLIQKIVFKNLTSGFHVILFSSPDLTRYYNGLLIRLCLGIMVWLSQLLIELFVVKGWLAVSFLYLAK